MLNVQSAPHLWHPLGILHLEQGVQQGDPLGTLLFSLVLDKVVSEITANSVCADLSYHAWYLDDGVLAGPRPAVLQALSIIQEIGPIVNFPKCEIFSKHDVSPFPPEMKRSAHPNIVIPIGDKAFCSTFILEKHEEAKALLLKLEEVSAVNPLVPFPFYVNVHDSASWTTLLVAHHPSKPYQPLRPLIMTSEQPSPSTWQLTPPIRPGNQQSSACAP